MHVHAGSLNPRLMRVQDKKVSHFVAHPRYDNVSQYYDVALVFLTKVTHLHILHLLNFIFVATCLLQLCPANLFTILTHDLI